LVAEEAKSIDIERARCFLNDECERLAALSCPSEILISCPKEAPKLHKALAIIASVSGFEV
jgi:hypothetical protein